MATANNLLILGASARAAAFSALAAGLKPICGDASADADLAIACQSTAAQRYPSDLAEISSAAPPGPWMYTGALENHRELVSQISAARPLLGNSASVLARVRDPFAVASALTDAGLSAPSVRRTSDGLPRDGSWLRKPLNSSGGTGVIPWTPAVVEAASEAPKHARVLRFFQQRIIGRPCAAIYVATGGASQLLGASEQLLFARSPNAAFRYVGSVGPLPLANETADRLRRIGEALAAEFQLVGLFGVDYIDDGRDVWPVEVNPRYTASTEILERGLGFSAVGWHVAACRDGRLPGGETASADRNLPPNWHAKRILYARETGIVDGPLVESLLAASRQDGYPMIADIPRAGADLLPGKPILTLFGRGASREAALAEIDRAAAAWSNRLPI